MTTERRRALYLCYLSLEDPLVHTQVIAYLRGLVHAGHEIHLLTFEAGRLSRRQRRKWQAELAQDGLNWHRLRYHKRPSLPATVYDTLAGGIYASWLVRRHRLDTLHARSHIPAAMALISRRLTWATPKLIFDIRGLWAEEYVDAGRWRKGGVRWRLTKVVERAAIRGANGIVVLTERVRHQLFGSGSGRAVQVIPCCADVERISADRAFRERKRAEMRLASATVMVYVGKFGGSALAREMAEFFRVAREEIPELHFLVLTQGPPDEIKCELQATGVSSSTFTIGSVSPTELGRYLSAADFGISFVRPAPSTASSSPTKVGEYLAAGLPVVSTAGVGDLDRLITPEIGSLVYDHDQRGYHAAARHIIRLLEARDTATRCRRVAETELSLTAVGIPRYRQLYEALAC
jgi:glycosyltransferase involved in cell wall biosynthesis